MIKEKVLNKKTWNDKQEKIINISFKILSVVLILLIVSGCSKESLNKKSFIEKMEAKKYSVTDISNNDMDIVLAVTDNYQIYYYKFKNQKTAKEMLKKEVNKLTKNGLKVNKKSRDNYDIYECSNNGIYTIYSRVDNTYIFISSQDTYKNSVSKTIKYLGY